MRTPSPIRGLLAIATSLLWALTLGCPDTPPDDGGVLSDAGTDGQGGATVDEILGDLDAGTPEGNALLEAIATYYARCTPTALIDLVDPGLAYPEAVIGDYRNTWRLQLLVAELTRPNAELIPENLTACIAAYEALSCDVELHDYRVVCEPLTRANAELGEVCGIFFSADACVDGLFCGADVVNEGGCGTCRLPAGLGEPCGETACAEDLECWFGPGGQGQYCAARVALGDYCFDTAREDQQPCEEGAYCDYDSRKCLAMPTSSGEGDSCDTDFDCSNMDHVCYAPLHVCGPPLIGTAAGEPCSPKNMFSGHEPCGSVHLTGLYCETNPDGSGTCRDVEVVELGEACDEENGRYCRHMFTTARCDRQWSEENPNAGVCVPRNEIGDPCTSWNDCVSDAFCYAAAGSQVGTCVGLPTEGQPCVGEGSCAPGLACDPERVCRPWSSIADGENPFAGCWE